LPNAYQKYLTIVFDITHQFSHIVHSVQSWSCEDWLGWWNDVHHHHQQQQQHCFEWLLILFIQLYMFAWFIQALP
jgi:hypothetical protein